MFACNTVCRDTANIVSIDVRGSVRSVLQCIVTLANTVSVDRENVLVTACVFTCS